MPYTLYHRKRGVQTLLLFFLLWAHLPGKLVAQTAVYRLNAGGSASTSTIGSFAADQYFSGGTGAVSASTATIAGTNDPTLYRSERNGNFTYALPVSNGQYTVVLHFAELAFTRSGQRVFDVFAESRKVLPNFDIAREVGAMTATTERFAVNVTDGTLTLAFSSGRAGVPKVCAIEVLSAAQICNVAPPVATSPVVYCVGSTAALLSSHVTPSAGATVLLYASASGGSPLADFQPTTSTIGSTTYYVSQTANNCESARTAVVVNVMASPSAPVVTNPTYCVGAQAALLSSNCTLSSGATLRLYTSASGFTTLADFRPSTATAGSTTFYAAQVVGTCESSRSPITVAVISGPAKPAVITPLTYAQGASSAPLSNSVTMATGGSLRIYDAGTAGTILPANFQPPTNAVGSTTYYVAQVVNGCESLREGIVVDVPAGPATPPTTPNTYTITATYTALPASQTATYALLKYNKRIGLQLTTDDGGKADINCIPPVLNGGRAANGVTYPGVFYTDGAGTRLHPGFTFAVSTLINGQPGRDGASNEYYATWAEYQTLKSYRNLGYSNHSSNHGPENPAAQLTDADVTFERKLGVIPRTVTIPGGFPGFVAATLADPKKLAVISQGYGSNGESADGHTSEICWLDKVSLPYAPPTVLILSRYFINQDWTAPTRAWVDEKFQLATNEYNAGRRVMLSAFDHFPGNQTANLAAFYSYVQSHPLNVGSDNVWFANLQEFAEYEEIKAKCPISSAAVSGNTLTWTINKAALPSYSLYQDASLLIPMVGLQNVVVTGGDGFSVNVATGLVNIAKLNTPTLTASRSAGATGQQGGSSSAAAARKITDSATTRTPATAAQQRAVAEPVVNIYPNPSSSEVRVDFTLVKAQAYSVAICDAKGVLVKMVATGTGQAGAQYSYRISNHDLGSGIYFVRLTTGTTSKTFRLNTNR